MEQQQEPPRAMAKHKQQPQHFLIVTYPAQGHITPARHLARRLAAASPGARATVCVPLSAFRRMFPGTAGEEETDGGVEDEGRVAYAAYSDGYDAASDSYALYVARARAAGAVSLAGVLRNFRERGRPVTCAAYTLLLPWVAGVAREQGVKETAVFWIQPATALAAYYHYFRGHRDAVVAAAACGDKDAEVRVPGLPPMRVRDLPSFLAVTSEDDPFAFVLPEFRDLVDAVERRSEGCSSPTYVLANTFEDMEPEALASLRPHVDVFAVGPVLSFLSHGGGDTMSASLSPPPRDLFEHDGESNYLEWLDSKPDRSVVYISFGSSLAMSRKQVAEVAGAMALINRPFLWVLRKDNCKDPQEDARISELVHTAVGLVVGWCDQARVLSHRAVACFVTHCGWNSALEAAACGVPLVAAPQYSDQGTGAWLVEQRFGTGVRAAAGEEEGGVVEAAELARCVEAATSGAVAARAAEWRGRARAAVADGGSSDRDLKAFLGEIAVDSACACILK